jgi:hypothetical protein
MAEILKQLQDALQIFENYCNTWKFKANKNTTKVVVFYRAVAIPIDCQLKLFDQLILPILSYGTEIWGHENVAISI